MVYVVDATGKVFKFCDANGWSMNDVSAALKKGEEVVGHVRKPVYAGYCHPNSVTQATDGITAKSIANVLQVAADVIELQPQGSPYFRYLGRIKRAIKKYDMRSREWSAGGGA